MSRRGLLLVLLLTSCWLPAACLAGGDRRFSTLLSDSFLVGRSVVDIREDCGLEVFWWEVWEGSALEALSPDLATLYYRRVARDGTGVVDKKALIGCRWAAYTSILRQGKGRILVTWTNNDWDNIDDLHWLVVNSRGRIVHGPGLAPGLSYHVLVRDSRGAAYGVGQPNSRGLRGGIDLYAVRVYPNPGDTLVSVFDGLRQHRFGMNISSSYSADMTYDDNILLCARPGPPSSPESDKSEWKHDEAICLLVDVAGQMVWGPRRLMLHRDGFRKIPGAYLGGWTIEDTKKIGGGIDLTTIPGGEMILSLTCYDPEGQICICQARFTRYGRPVGAESVKTVRPQRVSATDFCVCQKVDDCRVFETTGVKERSEFCVYGFDKEGSFYWQVEPRAVCD